MTKLGIRDLYQMTSAELRSNVRRLEGLSAHYLYRIQEMEQLVAHVMKWAPTRAFTEEEFGAQFENERSKLAKEIKIRARCKRCQEPFDVNDHLPMVLSCGHMYCEECIAILHRQNKKACLACKKPITQYLLL